ncbi:nucleotidyltransferase domain-containing protein [Caenispirillum salinarum]|uniref:nucleotidyltransferase domain-containing protein n=1 Tax=Caenispirillum salinarum TaxID=859058 RepID=UPI00384BCBA7
MGIETRVFGSLASGRFGVASDIDLAVTCPRDRKCTIESHAQEIAGDIPVEVVCLDELLSGRTAVWTNCATPGKPASRRRWPMLPAFIDLFADLDDLVKPEAGMLAEASS